VLGTIAALSRAAGTFEHLVGAALIGGMAVSLAIIGLAAPALYRRGRARFAVMASGLADWLFHPSLIVGTALLRHEDLWMIALFAVTLVVELVLYVPLLRRLTKDPDRSAHEVGSL
jgi:hypothetical protein